MEGLTFRAVVCSFSLTVRALVARILLRVGSITGEVDQAIAKQYGQEFLDKLKHWGQ